MRLEVSVQVVGVCRFIQNLSDVPNALVSRSAVSGLIARLPCTISLIRRGGTLIA